MAKLFLTSNFYKVTDKLCELVPTAQGLRVAFIPTAANMYTGHPWLDADREALVDMGFDVFDFDLQGKQEAEVYAALRLADIIFIGGGNTFYLLYHSQQSGFARVLPTLLEQGKVYIGSSAGSVLVGPSAAPVQTMDDPAEAPELTSFDALSIVPFVVLPHYGNPKYQQQYNDMIAAWSGKYELKTLTDTEVVIVNGDTIRTE